MTIIHGNGRVKLRDKKTLWKSLYTVYTISSLPTDVCYDIYIYINWVFDILSVLCHNIDCAISNSNKLSRRIAGWYKSSYFEGVSQRQANKNRSNLTQTSSEGMHRVIRHVPDSIVCGANMGPSWGRQDPGEPHGGPVNFVTWGVFHMDVENRNRWQTVGIVRGEYCTDD